MFAHTDGVTLTDEGRPTRGTRTPKWLATIDRWLMFAIRILLGLAVLVELVVVLANIVDRELFHHSLAWELPGAEFAVLAIAFLGGAIAFCSEQHISVDYVTKHVGDRTREAIRATGQWTGIVIAVAIIIWAIQSYHQATLQTISGISLTDGTFAIVLIVAMGVLAVDTCIKLIDNDAWANLAGAVATAVLVAIVVGSAHIPGFADSQDQVLILATVLALVTVVVGLPLTVALLIFLTTYTISGHNVTAFVPLGLEGALGDFVLLAIPFFVLAGFIMTEGRLAQAIIELLAPLLRRLPGGNLQLTLGTMFVFSGMTGAKIADVTAVGTAMTPTLVDDGFERAEIACVLASCASAGETIPPSIALLILGSVTTISIGTLFVAGILPALLVVLAIGVLVAVRDRLGRIRSTSGASSIARTVSWRRRYGRGALAIGLPVILLTGIESGTFTATEASAVAVVYAMVVTTILTPRITPRRMWAVLEQSASMAGLVLLLVAISSTVGQAAAAAGVPQAIATHLASLSDSPDIFILITVALVPIAGALLEGIPAILIFAPLLVPTAEQLHINLVHYGIVFILALGLGAFSPLLGVGFYTACKVAGADVSAATRRYLPYFGAMIAAILIIAFLPSITLVIPRLLGYAGA